MTIRIGLIGCGVMGEDHARILVNDVPGAELAGLFEPSAERLDRVRILAPNARVFDDAVALIDDAGIDAVLVAAPDKTHAPLALAAIRAGKPVLVEKPLGASTEAARAVLDAEVASGRRLVQVGFMRRFDPGYTALRDTVESGRLGAPLLLHCLHRNQVAPSYVTSDLIIANAVVHEFDIARFLLGEEIKAITVTPARASVRAPERRPLVLVLESETGTVVTVEAFIDAQYGYDVQAELVCEDGTRSLNPSPATVERRGEVSGHAVHSDWRGRFVEAYRLQLRDFVRFAAGGPPAGASSFDGFAASFIADVGLKALDRRERIAIDVGLRPDLYR